MMLGRSDPPWHPQGRKHFRPSLRST